MINVNFLKVFFASLSLSIFFGFEWQVIVSAILISLDFEF